MSAPRLLRTLLPALRRAGVPLGLGLAAFALYWPALGNGLTNWDDPDYVLYNPIAARGLGGLGSALTSVFDDAWYPLTQAVYCLIQAAAGPSPFAHHLVQALLFAATVALVPAALTTFRVPASAGVIAALLWATHPFRVESVAWAANLKDVLMALGAVASFALYPRHRAASAIAFAGALLAKSMAWPLAGLFVLLDLARSESAGRALRRSWPWWGPALAVAAISASLHLGESGASRVHPGGDLVAALPTAAWLPWWYLGRSLVPWQPRVLYAFEPVGWSDPRLALGLVLWAVVVAWIARRPAARRWPWVLGLAAWSLPFATVTGLAPLSNIIAERYTLLPSLALAAGLAVALVGWVRTPWRRNTIAAVACVVLAGATLARQPAWRDGIALWESNRPHAPEVFALRYNLGGAYGAAGRFDEAITELRAARRIDPGSKPAASALALALVGRYGVPAERWPHWQAELERGGFSREAIGRVEHAAMVAGQPRFARALAREFGAKEEASGQATGLRARRAMSGGRDHQW